jgi:thioredoxin 1
MPKIVNASELNALISSKAPVLIDFYADWCGPCKAVAPSLEQISKEFPDLTVAKVNVDAEPVASAQYGVRSIPTLVLVADGQVKSVKVGAFPLSALREWVQGTL